MLYLAPPPVGGVTLFPSLPWGFSFCFVVPFSPLHCRGALSFLLAPCIAGGSVVIFSPVLWAGFLSFHTFTPLCPPKADLSRPAWRFGFAVIFSPLHCRGFTSVCLAPSSGRGFCLFTLFTLFTRSHVHTFTPFYLWLRRRHGDATFVIPHLPVLSVIEGHCRESLPLFLAPCIAGGHCRSF